MLTLLDLSFVIHAISVLMLVVVSMHLADRVGIYWWAAADLSFAGGFGLLIAWKSLPDWGHPLLDNVLIDAGTGLTFIGVARFLHRPAATLWPLVPALLIEAGQVFWFFAHGVDFHAGTLMEAVVRVWLTGATAWLLARHAEPELRPASTFLSRVYLLWMAMLAGRMAWWVFWADSSTDPTRHDPTTEPALFARTCLIFLTTPSYLWMLLRRLTADIARQATQDPLTGLANRRLIWGAGEAELPRANRNGKPLAVLMMDIDHFKSINDRWGHKGGDMVLVAVAKAMQAIMRRGETLSRIGGEEFLVLLPETTLEGARLSAERLRHAVEEITIGVPEGKIECTISIGAAEYPRHGGGWDELVLAADKALYEAKRQGRNRVVTA